MTNKYFKIIRAQEEITRLNVEIRHLQAWVDMEDADIERMATELDSTDTRLAAELWLLYNRQHRINDMHRNCLAHIYRLPGYTGCIPLQVNTVVTSSENEEEYDPMLEGEASARFESCIQQISQWCLVVDVAWCCLDNVQEFELFLKVWRLAYGFQI